MKKEAGKRNPIEGIFGNAKRKYGLGLGMTKTTRTSENWIAIVIFVMNLVKMAEYSFFFKYYTVNIWYFYFIWKSGKSKIDC